MQKEISQQQIETLVSVLKNRFKENTQRHPDIKWLPVEQKLIANPKIIWSLSQMEQTGGEPDVIGHGKSTDEFIFYDCAMESPKGRRSLCYDNKALESRKENAPKNSALGMAAEMGIELLTEVQYHELQKHGDFDTKTSSWIKTPSEIRELGGALFCDRRYNTVFTYHNGAESYYAARGFRGVLKV